MRSLRAWDRSRARTVGVLCALWLFGCRIPLSGEVTPAEPGTIEISPVGAVISPSGTVTLTARLFVGGAPAAVQPSFTFVSDDPAYLEVVGSVARGRGVEGVGHVRAVDGVHGDGVGTIRISSMAASGTTGFACRPGSLAVRVGDTITPTLEFFDAMGRTTSGDDVTLITDTDALLIAGRSLTGVRSGLATIRAQAGDVPVYGACTVTVVAGGGSPSGITCEPLDVTDSCWVSAWASHFAVPGLSAPIRVSEQRLISDTPPLCWRTETRTRVPFEVANSNPEVAAVFGDRLVALAPGLTELRVSTGGRECMRFTVRVGMDMSGSWSLSCDDGAEAVLTFGPPAGTLVGYRSIDEYFPASGAPTTGTAIRWSGSGSYCPGSGTDGCDGMATASQGPWLGGSLGLCSRTRTCFSPAITHCGGGAGGMIESESAISDGSCRLRRGGGAAPRCSCDGFECGDGTCVDPSRVCNRATDCATGADEIPSMCGSESGCCRATRGCPAETGSSCGTSCCCCPANQRCCSDWSGCCPA